MTEVVDAWGDEVALASKLQSMIDAGWENTETNATAPVVPADGWGGGASTSAEAENTRPRAHGIAAVADEWGTADSILPAVDSSGWGAKLTNESAALNSGDSWGESGETTQTMAPTATEIAGDPAEYSWGISQPMGSIPETTGWDENERRRDHVISQLSEAEKENVLYTLGTTGLTTEPLMVPDGFGVSSYNGNVGDAPASATADLAPVFEAPSSAAYMSDKEADSPSTAMAKSAFSWGGTTWDDSGDASTTNTDNWGASNVWSTIWNAPSHVPADDTSRPETTTHGYFTPGISGVDFDSSEGPHGKVCSANDNPLLATSEFVADAVDQLLACQQTSARISNSSVPVNSFTDEESLRYAKTTNSTLTSVEGINPERLAMLAASSGYEMDVDEEDDEFVAEADNTRKKKRQRVKGSDVGAGPKNWKGSNALPLAFNRLEGAKNVGGGGAKEGGGP